MATAAFALLRRHDSDGAYLRQMRAVEVKRAAADDHAAIFEDHEIAYVLADFRQGSRQQSAVTGVVANQRMNSRCVRKNGFTRAHAHPPEWIRFSGEPRPSPVSLAPAPFPLARRGWQARIQVSGRRRSPDRTCCSPNA